jgi:hypothetical protein
VNFSSLLPQEQSTKSISEYLSNQHGFICNCNRCQMSSAITSSDAKIEEEMLEYERGVMMSKLYSTADCANYCRQVIKWTKAVEENSLLGTSPELLGRLWKVAVNASAVALEVLGSSNEHPSKQKYFAMKFLRSNMSLEQYQLVYLGEKHPDLARTYQDIAEAFDGLLSNDSSLLLENEDFASKSMTELKELSKQYRKKGLILRDLYNRRKKYPNSMKFHLTESSATEISIGDGNAICNMNRRSLCFYWG